MKKLKTFATSVTFLDKSGKYITTFGPRIEAESFDHAEEVLQEKGYSHCTIRFMIEFEDKEYWNKDISTQDELCMKMYSSDREILA